MSDKKWNEKEIKAIVREGFSLSFEDNLSVTRNADFPMKLSNISRFSLFASDSRKEDTANYFRANIPQADVKGIYDKTQAALNAKAQWEIMNQFKQFSSNNEEKTDAKDPWAALDATFKFGGWSGKTVAEYALASTEEAIIRQRDFLEQKASLYPANKEMVEQLNKALELKKAGIAPLAEKKATPAKEAVLTIYDMASKPLLSTEKEGSCVVYDVAFLCHVGYKFPWEIRIGNQWCPVSKDGRGKPVVGKATVPRKQTSILCSDEEFLGVINRMVELTNAFVNDTTSEMRQKMMAITEEKRNSGYSERSVQQ